MGIFLIARLINSAKSGIYIITMLGLMIDPWPFSEFEVPRREDISS